LAETYDLVVHSHLRWDGVFQRPHHIISRLSKQHRVAFIEEPIFLEPGAPASAVRLESRHEPPNVTVVQPFLPPQEPFLPAVSRENQQLNRGLVEGFLAREGYRDVVRWHYAPMAIYLAGACTERAAVYDCMDELSAFKGAPPELMECERALMRQAGAVFTGGRSIFEAKRAHHANIYRFDSGVDVEHFGKATQAATPVPDDARELPHPILGYYGVIDERMDLEAIRRMAEREPSWQLLLIGPVTKIDPAELPQAPNIHYTGQRSYDELPGYLKAFDVCLIPFADNEATRYLSPTKTLEYFAGLKPIVSSPVADVVEHYSRMVRIARSPDEYVSQVRAALTEDNRERLAQGLEAARAHTWDSIVAQMSDLVDQVLGQSS
jgi:glycosyltransferase involved in cell wall biosynthesis